MTPDLARCEAAQEDFYPYALGATTTRPMEIGRRGAAQGSARPRDGAGLVALGDTLRAGIAEAVQPAHLPLSRRSPEAGR